MYIYIYIQSVCVYIYIHIYISIPLVFWSNISRQQLGMELPGVKHFLSKTSLVSLGSYCPSLASETLGGPCFSENWECILYAEPYILCMCIYIYIVFANMYIYIVYIYCIYIYYIYCMYIYAYYIYRLHRYICLHILISNPLRPF